MKEHQHAHMTDRISGSMFLVVLSLDLVCIHIKVMSGAVWSVWDLEMWTHLCEEARLSSCNKRMESKDGRETSQSR